jgi:hypothetical protein
VSWFITVTEIYIYIHSSPPPSHSPWRSEFLKYYFVFPIFIFFTASRPSFFYFILFYFSPSFVFRFSFFTSVCPFPSAPTGLFYGHACDIQNNPLWFLSFPAPTLFHGGVRHHPAKKKKKSRSSFDPPSICLFISPRLVRFQRRAVNPSLFRVRSCHLIASHSVFHWFFNFINFLL